MQPQIQPINDKKNVSWGENEMREIKEFNENDSTSLEDNIFKKLKRINTVADFNHFELNLEKPEKPEKPENINIQYKEFKNIDEDRFNNLEEKIEIINNKIEKILELLFK